MYESHKNRDWREDFDKVYSHSIGQGTFGKVSLVKSRTNERYYAMKEINLKQHILKSSLINRSYALDEGLKLIRLKCEHENIIAYHMAYIHNDHIYWIMDYCDGGTLRERISLYVKQDKYIEENLIWYWALQILKGIKYIHSKGLVHRDLKPDNVYIHGKRGLCKIGDFGFAKLVVDSSVTQNTVTIKHFSDERVVATSADERIAYKLINMSQVGTPSYIAPELRMLIDSHLNFSSVETINEKIKLCEQFIYKGDVFSFGCILYELTFLKLAFENRFQLPNDVYIKAAIEIDIDDSYSTDLRELIKACLQVNPAERPNVRQLMRMPQVDERLKLDLEEYYKKQVTPSLAINSKKNVLLCKSATLEASYRPIAMKSLKFNQNLIVILAVKQGHKYTNKNFNFISNTLAVFGSDGSDPLIVEGSSSLSSASSVSNDIAADLNGEPKLFVFNEYGQLVNELSSYLDATGTGRKPFTFAMFDLAVDEELNHLYVSTRRYGIMRFRILDTNRYFEDITFDGCLDLSELFASQQQSVLFFPTCLTLVEDETLFNKQTVQSPRITCRRRRLIFYDRASKMIVSVQVDLTGSNQSNQSNIIKCSIYAGLTLDQPYPVRQMVSTGKELICLFDDLSLINVYNLQSLLIIRSNRQVKREREGKTVVAGVSGTSSSSESFRKNTMYLTLSSDGQLYSTNGKSIFNLDYNDFRQKKRISPFVKKGENLAHTFSWITILTNSKLVLLTDALQMEPSTLFILKPVNNKSYD